MCITVPPQVFLTACLHQPLLELLADDELFLDTDPSKMVHRIPAQVRLTLISRPGLTLISRHVRAALAMND